MAENISQELLEELRALAHGWSNRIILGRYPDHYDVVRANTYEDCSDELNELLDNLTTN